MCTLLRKCLTCKIEKPATPEFYYREKNRYLGLMYRCKECDKKRPDGRIYKNRIEKLTEQQVERLRERNRAWNTSFEGRIAHQLSAYRKIDKTKGFICDLSKDDLRIVKESDCSYCGFPATGFDRVDNSKGHSKDNVVPCCKECNVARMDNFTFDEMKVIGLTIRSVKLQRLAA